MKRIYILLLVMVVMLAMAGCAGTEAEKASYNVSQEADNFNVVRELTVINCYGGDVLFQMTAKMSIEYDEVDKQLEIMVEDENGKYHKNFVGIGPMVTYVVNDVQGTAVNKYKYTINYNPKMWLPVEFDVID